MLASLLSKTACVEADFSRLLDAMSDYRSKVSYLSLEAFMQASDLLLVNLMGVPFTLRASRARHEGLDSLVPGHQGRSLATSTPIGKKGAPGNKDVHAGHTYKRELEAGISKIWINPKDSSKTSIFTFIWFFFGFIQI
jgi:hypothetical protein